MRGNISLQGENLTQLEVTRDSPQYSLTDQYVLVLENVGMTSKQDGELYVEAITTLADKVRKTTHTYFMPF